MTQVHIVSDGDGKSTYVQCPNGEILGSIREMTVTLAANEINTAELTLVMPTVNVEAKIKSVTFVCPCCGEEMSHTCQEGP